MNNILKHIFSMKNIEDRHKQIYILGIKINIPITHSKIHKIEKKIDNLTYQINNIKNLLYITTNIQDTPQASDFLATYQKASLKILIEIDRICKKHNIQYWLTGGTLLGTLRHRNLFIPWDDDVDIMMLRDDYNKFIDIFNNDTLYSNLKALLFTDCWHNLPKNKIGKLNITRVVLQKENNTELTTRDYPLVDIFPVDYYYKKTNYEEKIDLTKKIKEIIENLNFENIQLNTQEEIRKHHELINQIQTEQFLDNKYVDKSSYPSLFWGMEHLHAHNNWFNDYEDIFPLKTVNFCGHNFLAPNQPEKVLSYIYGNYMYWPNHINAHYSHNIASLYDYNDIKYIENFVDKGEIY